MQLFCMSDIFRNIDLMQYLQYFILFFRLTEADVYLYGHLQAILESKLPNNILLKTLEKFPKLVNFCLNFSQVHLGNKAMLWEFL